DGAGAAHSAVGDTDQSCATIAFIELADLGGVDRPHPADANDNDAKRSLTQSLGWHGHAPSGTAGCDRPRFRPSRPSIRDGRAGRAIPARRAPLPDTDARQYERRENRTRMAEK